jgi:DNA-binding XRE family transcriptional regulator
MAFINQNLHALRAHLQLNRQEMADSLHVKRTTYINYEEGDSEPKVDFLITLHKVYGVDINKFLTDVYSVTSIKFKSPIVQNVHGNHNTIIQSSTVHKLTVNDELKTVITTLTRIAKTLKRQESKKESVL